MLPPLPCGIFLCCEAIKKEKPNKVLCDPDEIDIYCQEASLFCVDRPLQVRMELATKNRIVLFYPFVLSEPLTLQDGGWKKESKMSASLRDNDEDSPYGYFLP